MNAMDKALKSIEMTFSPERKEVGDKIDAICRTAEMLCSDDVKWRKRAWTLVEKYNILGKNGMFHEITRLIESETKLIGHEYIKGADMNVKRMARAMEKLKT